jgi:hypothetical protein
MPPFRLPSTALVVALASASALAYLPACSSSTEGPSNSLTAGVLREGDPSDAAVTQLLSYEADDWGWAGGVFEAPSTVASDTSTDVELPASTPFTFVWVAAPVPSGDAAGAAGTLNAPRGFTGVAFLLVFSTPSAPKFLRIVTTASSFTPSAAEWKRLTSASEPVTLKVVSGTFENDELTVEGGPHQGQGLNLSFVGRAP